MSVSRGSVQLSAGVVFSFWGATKSSLAFGFTGWYSEGNGLEGLNEKNR